jgi:Fe-S-cluster containining protein
MIGEETYDLHSPCVFLNAADNSCDVHADKPAVCAAFRCWDAAANHLTMLPRWTRAELTELGWDGTDPDNCPDLTEF